MSKEFIINPSEIIYYNEMTGLKESYTQKNVDDNQMINLCGIQFDPDELLSSLRKNGSAWLETPIVDVHFENIHCFDEFKFRISVPDKNHTYSNNYDIPIAVYLIKKEKVNVN